MFDCFIGLLLIIIILFASVMVCLFQQNIVYINIYTRISALRLYYVISVVVTLLGTNSGSRNDSSVDSLH